MSQLKNQKLKNILSFSAWVVVGICCMALLIAAVTKKNTHTCKDIKVKIIGVKNNFFVDEKAVLGLLNKMHFTNVKGSRLAEINLTGMEKALKQNAWIKNAELYFDNNDVMKVTVYEREPVARIFATNGTSFYLDTSLTMLPLNPGYSARVPVFTGYVVPAKRRSKADSTLLRNISDISSYILADDFWMAQVDQVDINPGGTFEMVPKIGNQQIYFGTAENYVSKFENLLLFYRQVLRKVGFDKYRSLNLGFNNQVVAVKRNAEDIKQDSLRARELMKVLALKAQKENNDSTNNIQLDQKDENVIPLPASTDDALIEEDKSAPANTDVIKSPTVINKPAVIKPLTVEKNRDAVVKHKIVKKEPVRSPAKHTPVPQQKPIKKAPSKAKLKAVMKPQNDY